MSVPQSQSCSERFWSCSDKRVPLKRPLIMGVLNVTPDSFSDGGLHYQQEAAVQAGLRMLDEGADILDIGGESTRPGAGAVSIEEEMRRIIPVIETLSASGALISVDTRRVEVARAALAAGAHIINDVSGFRDPNMQELAASSTAGLIVMHMQGEPHNMQQNPCYNDALQEVCDYLSAQAQLLVDKGVEPSRIIIDPGPGFGKRAEHDAVLQLGFERLCSLGYPVLEAVSRKRFVGELSGIALPKERDLASISLSLSACYQGASMVRVHNVSAMHQALCASSLCFSQSYRAYIGLGSNLSYEGKSSSNLIEYAAAELDTLPLTRLVNLSPLYISEPAYYTEQREFCNAVACVETSLNAHVLLQALLAMEERFGRVRLQEDGPRTLDLDLLFYDYEIHGGEKLRLPHPGIRERDFVIKPLLNIMSDEELAKRLSFAGLGSVCKEEYRVGRAKRLES